MDKTSCKFCNEVHSINVILILTKSQRFEKTLALNTFCVNLYGMSKTVVVEVRKNPNENNSSVLRRFSRRIQESGIIRQVKANRYNVRKESKLKVKKGALKRMSRRVEIEKLKKLGKVPTR
jgi:ribosomal protein S21